MGNLLRALALAVVVMYLIIAVRLVRDDNVGVAVEALLFYVPVIAILLSLASYLDARSARD